MMGLLVDDLTAGSLQSVPELYRVLGYLGVDHRRIGATEKELRDVFTCRNRIIHELDIDFSQPNRNRYPRRQADMVGYASMLLDVGSEIIKGVDEQLL